MGKKNILIFYLLGWILVGIITTYSLKDYSLRQFFLEYRRYIIIVSCSCIYYYLIYDDEEVEHNPKKKILIGGNVYLFLLLFFRPVLHIKILPFILITINIIILRLIRKQKKVIKIPLFMIIGGITILLVCSGFFYLYPDAPDTQGFITTQKTQLIIQSSTPLTKQEIMLKLIDTQKKKEENILIKKGRTEIPLKDNIEIEYISNIQKEVCKIYLLDPEGNLFKILPQSIISRKEMTPIVKKGQIQWHPTLFENTLRETNVKNYKQRLGNISDEEYQEVTKGYWDRFEAYLYKQIATPFQRNKDLQKLNQIILEKGEIIFPGTFTENVKNEQDFKKYLKNNETSRDRKKEKTHTSTTITVTKAIRNNIQFSSGKLQTF